MTHSDGDLARVKAMEIACAFSPKDYEAYVQECGPVEHGGLCKGHQYSGSYCGRNIEKIYQKAAPSGCLGLQKAVDALLGQQVKHVLIITGFFVLHDNAGQAPNGGSAGSCETDGPLGALAIMRALASRGIRASLFCDDHNAPVIEKAYETMMRQFVYTAPDMHKALKKFSCCLKPLGDTYAGTNAANVGKIRKKAYGKGVPCTELQERWALLAHRLGRELKKMEVDGLVALERLGAPYRNIRGVDIGSDTEVVDFLFPFVDWEGPGDEEFRNCVRTYAEANKYTPEMRETLCRMANVSPTAVTIGIGDGGNEVGLGRVVSIPGVPQLTPGDEFAALSVNGCYRTCDHVILGAVSNWAGSAFEAAAMVLYPLSSKMNYMAQLSAGHVRRLPQDLEERILIEICAKPTSAVDGKRHEQRQSVDGMTFEPYHRNFYAFLWAITEQRLPGEPRKVRRLE